MSVVAWHQGRMYSDSCCDDTSAVKVGKLAVEAEDSYCGVTGQASDLVNFVSGKGIQDECSVVLQWTDGSLWVNNFPGQYVIDHTRTVAFGSGADIFLGAIATGCSVEVALSITEQLVNSVAAPFHMVQDGEVIDLPVPKFTMIKELE